MQTWNLIQIKLLLFATSNIYIFDEFKQSISQCLLWSFVAYLTLTYGFWSDFWKRGLA